MADFALSVGDDAITATAAGIEVGRYVFAPDAPAAESPKPYWHPLRALNGTIVTGYRPPDHLWHKGLQMTWTHVSGQNLWGGPTYVHGEGYVWKDNHGRMRHDAFRDVTLGGTAVGFTETLTWVTSGGEEWVAEERTHRLHGLDPERGVWALDFATTLHNIRGEELELGSPTTEGRDAAGYTGLFLRMPLAWAGAAVVSENGDDAGVLMGRKAPWAAVRGPRGGGGVDGESGVDGGGGVGGGGRVGGGGGATVIAYSGTSTGPGPIEWFARSEPAPVLAASPAFHDAITLGVGAELRLSHRHVFVDHILHDDGLRSLANELAP